MFTVLSDPACADSAIDFHDGRPAVVAAAKEICNRCPEYVACLKNAIKAEMGEPKAYRFGVFGGTTPDERFALEEHARQRTFGQSLTEAR